MQEADSIASWDETVDDQDEIRFEISFPRSNEVANVIQWLENNIQSRNGYDIAAMGSCAKGPQGINWTVRITFEHPLDADLFRSAMAHSFGPPGHKRRRVSRGI